MPEGPEIRRARDELAKVLEQGKVTKIFFAFDHLKPYQSKLKNNRIIEVNAKGKAMLIRFSNGYTIYSHNQLYGKWIISPDGKIPDVKRQLRLAIYLKQDAAFLYSASDISVLKDNELAKHPYLNKLGLELLSASTTEEMVVQRLYEFRKSRRSLMTLLQDQSILAGIGNYLCCEILHLSGLHPEIRICDLNDQQLKQLAHNSLLLTRQSYETSGITNLLSRANKLAKQGVEFEDYRFNVYRRQGLSCYQCGDVIVKEKFSGRMGYCCLGCQSLPK